MGIVYQKDKRVGITYAYESTSFWDREKKQPRSRRKLIGRLDEDTGSVIPTRNHKKKDDGASVLQYARRFYGATYLLDAIGDKLGLSEDLKACFPYTYKQMLSLIYYLILEDRNPLSRFEKWASTHKHPYGSDIPSQRSSELFAGITDDSIRRFFKLQGKRRAEHEYWAYDITSVSSYSESLQQVRYGHNKEDDRLPQINLALIFGEQSQLPFYYRKISGNIPDVKTVKGLLADLGDIGFQKVKLVMDNGFFSEDNINGLMKERLKFLIAAKTSLRFIQKELDRVYDDFRTFEYFNEEHELYSVTVNTEWGYKQERPYKKDVLEKKRRVYVHLYYNIDRATEDQKNFDRRLMELRKELLSGKRVPEHEKQYGRYFTIKSSPVRGTTVAVNKEAVKKAKRYYGFFSLLSNEKMDSMAALELYRNKDLAEKAFGNLKERLNFRRTLVSSERSLDGKLFVEFVALIYLSYLKKQITASKLGKDYTLTSLLDQLDVIECFEHPCKELRVGEILEKQRQLYISLGVPPPA
jgi:transposase